MFAHRIDEVLAQTDPFDLAQAVERCVSQLKGRDIRLLLADSRDRMSEYYLEEVERMRKTRMSDQQLRSEFTGFLRSNLRAITLFGSAFSSAVLAECPAHRVVAIGEEARTGRTRAILIGGVALALVILGAAGEHAVSNARVASQTPTEPSAPIVAPLILYPTTRPPVARVERRKRVATQVPATPTPTAPPATPAPTVAATVAGTVEPATAPVAPIVNKPLMQRSKPTKTPPPGRAVLTINVTPPPPTPEPTPLDVTDMPDSTSDATPLPTQPLATAANPDAGHVPTPKPTDRASHGWFNHLDPFRHGGHIRVP